MWQFYKIPIRFGDDSPHQDISIDLKFNEEQRTQRGSQSLPN